MTKKTEKTTEDNKTETKARAKAIERALLEAEIGLDMIRVKYFSGDEEDVHATDEVGGTPLMSAALLGRLESLLSLIEKGADVNATDDEGNTPLLEAAKSGNPKVVEALIKHGADINAQDKDGWTALMWAVHFGKPEMVETLIRAGADINAKDRKGWTALYLVNVKLKDKDLSEERRAELMKVKEVIEKAQQGNEAQAKPMGAAARLGQNSAGGVKSEPHAPVLDKNLDRKANE